MTRGIFTIFVSHQWLGFAHPDPQGVHCALLRETLQNIIDGDLMEELDLSHNQDRFVQVKLGEGQIPTINSCSCLLDSLYGFESPLEAEGTHADPVFACFLLFFNCTRLWVGVDPETSDPVP